MSDEVVIEKATVRPDSSIMGVTGLRRFGPQIYEEYLPELQGSKGRQVVREMVDDPVIGAVLLAVEMLLRKVDWPIEPRDDSSEAKKLAEFYEQCRDDMSMGWHDTLSEILTYIPYGWDLQEIVYKLRKGPSDNPKINSKFNDGKVGWRKWSTRSQDTLFGWEFDEEGGVQGMMQSGAPDYQMHFIPIEKSLLFRTTARKGNPEGRPGIRSAYRPYYFARHIENIEGVGIERDLAGYPVLKVPASILRSDASSEDKAFAATLQNLVTQVKRDELEGMLIPSDRDDKGELMYEFTLVSTGSRRQFDTNQILERYATYKALFLLADFVLLGHQQVGSFALSDSKTEVFTTAMGAFMDIICSVITSHAFPRLAKLNGFDPALVPKQTHGEIKSVDVQKFATAIMNLSQSGMPLFPDDELEKHIRRELGLPEKTPGSGQPMTPAQPMMPTTASGAPLPPSGRPPTPPMPRINTPAPPALDGQPLRPMGGQPNGGRRVIPVQR